MTVIRYNGQIARGPSGKPLEIFTYAPYTENFYRNIYSTTPLWSQGVSSGQGSFSSLGNGTTFGMLIASSAYVELIAPAINISKTTGDITIEISEKREKAFSEWSFIDVYIYVDSGSWVKLQTYDTEPTGDYETHTLTGAYKNVCSTTLPVKIKFYKVNILTYLTCYLNTFKIYE